MPNNRPALDAAVAFCLFQEATGAAPVRPGVRLTGLYALGSCYSADTASGYLVGMQFDGLHPSISVTLHAGADPVRFLRRSRRTNRLQRTAGLRFRCIHTSLAGGR
jgi:hypothetical protein